MENIFENLIVKFLILMTIIPCAKSEESGDIYLGALFGYGQSIHQNPVYQFKLLSNEFYCLDDIDKADAKDYYLGLRLEYILFASEYFANSICLSSNYESSHFTHRNPGDTYPSLIQDDSSSNEYLITTSSTEIEEEVNINYINFDLLYSFELQTFLNFGISLGPFISLPVKTSISEDYKLITPKNAQFSRTDRYKYKDNYRTVVFYEGKINNLNPFYWGIKTNCFIEYEFWDLLKTTAEVGYSYPLSNFVKDSDWKIESYYANLIISFKLNNLIENK